MKRRLLVISQYFYPEQFRVTDMCKEWVKRGYEVTVITGIPNYPQGQFYKGYSLFKHRKEEYEGITIIRLPIISRGNNNIRLAFNYLSFVFSGFFFSNFTRIKADFVYIHEVSPMTQALVGVWFANRRKIPCILYVTDLWPENVEVLSGITNKHVLNLIGRMVDNIYAGCTRILTASNSFVKAIEKRGVTIKKIEYWPHYAEDFYYPRDKAQVSNDSIPQDGKFNVVFTGNLGKAQGLDILPTVAGYLKKQGVKVRFNIIGDGRAKTEIVNAVKINGVEEYFNFINWKPAEIIPEYMALCDAALICLTRSTIFAMTIPTKLQSYLACGMPIIASGEGEIHEIINDANLGLCSPPGDVKGLANNIIKMRKMPIEVLKNIRNNAITYYKEHFNKTQLLNRMDTLLIDLSEDMKNV